jgi:pimeloyl-ACP methyl ester carboxylesterase
MTSIERPLSAAAPVAALDRPQRRHFLRTAGASAVLGAAAVAATGSARAAQRRQGMVRLAAGNRISYLEQGSGPVLLLVPGWSQTAEMYDAQLNALSDRYRVIAVDMRGHGDSDKAPGGYRIARLALDLRKLIVTLDLNDVALGGHSMGCSVIWSYWDQFGSDRLSKLVLIDQAPTVVALPGWSDAQKNEAGAFLTPQGLYDLAGSIGGADGVAATDGFVQNAFFTKAYPRDKLGWVLEQNLKFPRPHAARLLVDHCTQDWRDTIRTIDVPTVVFGGTASFFHPDSQRWIASQIPGAKAHIFDAAEGGSHFMFMENPTKFNAIVRDFLG